MNKYDLLGGNLVRGLSEKTGSPIHNQLVHSLAARSNRYLLNAFFYYCQPPLKLEEIVFGGKFRKSKKGYLYLYKTEMGSQKPPRAKPLPSVQRNETLDCAGKTIQLPLGTKLSRLDLSIQVHFRVDQVENGLSVSYSDDHLQRSSLGAFSTIIV